MKGRQDFEDVPDDSNKSSFAKWACWTSRTCAFFHGSRCTDKGPTSIWEKDIRFITAKNRVLVDFEQTLEEADIEDGECLTALVLQPQLAATGSAFALWCHGDSAVVTWGDVRFGGDSSAVQDQLKGVRQIQASGEAFAAIREDGSVVTWGDAAAGGDSSAVRDQLKGRAANSGTT